MRSAPPPANGLNPNHRPKSLAESSSSWQARISTKGESDVWMLENRIVPGGSLGWHSHPGPSIVVVKSGGLTLYRGDGPSCTPETGGAGSGFVEYCGDLHLGRNAWS